MKTLGAFEFIDIPILGLTNIKSKIDTGASISTIHSPFYDTIIKNGTSHVIYKLLSSDAIFSASRFTVVNVTNSFGDTEIRYQVPLTIKLNNEYFESQFTLTDRKELPDKVLIGKNIIQVGNFLVDIKKPINENEDGMIKCDNCGHKWQKSIEDTNPNLCHVCMFDGFKGAFTA